MIEGEKFERGLRLVLEAVGQAQREPGSPPLSSEQMRRTLDELERLRGRPEFYPYLGSGIGKGAKAMLADGRWVMDFVLGVGVHFFGHGNLDLIETALRAAPADIATQGNLIFNLEYHGLMKTLLRHAPSGIEHCWLSTSGTEANENALKLARLKRGGRPGVIGFRGCFHGRTTAMAEITNRPAYKHGQPRTFPVEYIPFYDRGTPDSARNSLEALRDVIRRSGDRMAALFVELVQGENGFVAAPRSFFVPLMEECVRAGIPILIDEVQTFGRTTELFATDMLDLAQYADIITVGKILQGSAMLTKRDTPIDRYLVSGTLSGSTVSMAVGRRIVEKLTSEGLYGPEGRIARLERLTREHLGRLAAKHPGKVSAVDGSGAMLSFRFGAGSLAVTRAFIRKCFDAGLVLYYGGYEPACVRLFLPAGVLTDDELGEAVDIMEGCL